MIGGRRLPPRGVGIALTVAGILLAALGLVADRLGLGFGGEGGLGPLQLAVVVAGLGGMATGALLLGLALDLLLLVGGAAIWLGSLLSDPLGLSPNPGFGAKQIVPAELGLAAVLAGMALRHRRAQGRRPPTTSTQSSR